MNGAPDRRPLAKRALAAALATLMMALAVTALLPTAAAHAPSSVTATYIYTTDGGDGDSWDAGDGGGGTAGADRSADGTVEAGEYEFSATFGGGDFRLHWTIDGTTIHMAMVGKTTGWVAIGISPTNRMDEADMIFGWVEDGVAVVLDSWSLGPTGPHEKDTDLGGTDDLLSSGGREEGGRTTIEFSRKLSTGDDYDNPIPADGELDIIWAIGDTDSPSDQHSDLGYATINLNTGESGEEDAPDRWVLHAVMMLWGTSLMLWAGVIAGAKRKNWLKVHRALGALGSLFAVIGLSMGIVMVQQAGGPHLAHPHTWLGVVTMAFAIVTPVTGFRLMKGEDGAAKKRALHGKLGRYTTVLMAINTISGFLVAYGVL